MTIATVSISEYTTSPTTSTTPYLVQPRAYAEEAREYAQKTAKELTRSDTIILNGHGCGLSISKDALAVKQGSITGEPPETTQLHRGVHTVKQIVILSSSGNLSIDALHWCKEQDINIVLLDQTGHLLYSLAPEARADAAMRRLQYRISESKAGAKLAIDLVAQKTRAQLATVQAHRELNNHTWTCKILEDAMQQLTRPAKQLYDITALQQFEGRIASTYFDAFEGLPIKWATKDAAFVPPHWARITPRSSPLSCNGTARHAVCPFHAATNYLMAVTEHQLLGAINMVGLDPACGFLHKDQALRNSLVYDLIEPLRAKVDDRVLSIFQSLTWKRGDIIPTKEGHFFFNAQVARYLVAKGKLEESTIMGIVIDFKKALHTMQ